MDLLKNVFIEQWISRRMDSKNLSKNESLPWSNELLERFDDKWHWNNKKNYESKDSKYILTKDINSLSTNEKLPWSEDFIEKYKDKWNWDMLSTNNGLPWSMHLLEKFEDQWVWFNKEQDMTASLWVNNTLWEKVFKPYVNDEMIEEVISGINIDSLNTPYNKTMLYNA